MGYLDGFVDLRLSSSCLTRAIGNRRATLRMRKDGIDNHRHEYLVFGRDGTILQHSLVLCEVPLSKLRFALLEWLDLFRLGISTIRSPPHR
jgi:hypothetical protein